MDRADPRALKAALAKHGLHALDEPADAGTAGPDRATPSASATAAEAAYADAGTSARAACDGDPGAGGACSSAAAPAACDDGPGAGGASCSAAALETTEAEAPGGPAAAPAAEAETPGPAHGGAAPAADEPAGAFAGLGPMCGALPLMTAIVHAAAPAPVKPVSRASSVFFKGYAWASV